MFWVWEKYLKDHLEQSDDTVSVISINFSFHPIRKGGNGVNRTDYGKILSHVPTRPAAFRFLRRHRAPSVKQVASPSRAPVVEFNARADCGLFVPIEQYRSTAGHRRSHFFSSSFPPSSFPSRSFASFPQTSRATTSSKVSRILETFFLLYCIFFAPILPCFFIFFFSSPIRLSSALRRLSCGLSDPALALVLTGTIEYVYFLSYIYIFFFSFSTSHRVHYVISNSPATNVATPLLFPQFTRFLLSPPHQWRDHHL